MRYGADSYCQPHTGVKQQARLPVGLWDWASGRKENRKTGQRGVRARGWGGLRGKTGGKTNKRMKTARELKKTTTR